MMESRASRRRRISGAILHAFAFGSGAVVCLELALIIGYIFVRGIPGITAELLTTQPSYIHDTIGVLPNILNTLYIVLVAMAVVIPLGVCAAVYLSEYATNRPLVRLISFAVETLTGIPSVVFGLVGMLFFIQMMGFSAGVLSGGLTLAVMVLPTIISNTLESLRTVPDAYREGALALGSGRWHMVRTVVLPNALDGIATGCILAVGRIVGESAALLYTAGFGIVLNGFMTALQSSSATLTVALYIYATERGELTVAFSVATILMVITMLLNLATNTVSSKLGEKEKGHE
jgi:phosphate transport system permease protein